MKDVILTNNCQSKERHNKQSRECIVCLNLEDIWYFRQKNLSCIICLKFRGHNIQLLGFSNSTYKINCPSQLLERAKTQRGNVLSEWTIYLGRNLHGCFVFCIRNGQCWLTHYFTDMISLHWWVFKRSLGSAGTPRYFINARNHGNLGLVDLLPIY